MKKLIGTVIVASLLAATAAQAQEITPLESTASSQSQLIALGAVPTGAIVLGTVVILGTVFAIVEASDGT